MITTLFLLLLAQTGRQRVVVQPAQISDWKVEITTDGGFSGQGSGNVTVSSNGTLVITLLNKKECNYQLTAGELQALNAAIANARPATWSECYSLADVSTHCCDLIRTTFSLSANGDRSKYVTSWLTGVPPLPLDLQNIVDLLRGPAGIDTRYRALCASTP